MLEYILRTLYSDLIVILLAMLPTVELRGSIPYGMAMGLSARHALVVSLVGSILPAVVILLYLKPITDWLKGWGLASRLIHWTFRRADSKRGHIDRWGMMGLFLLIAVPLPGTGVWTGSILAVLLRLPPLKALVAIALGNLAAGLIVAGVMLHVL